MKTITNLALLLVLTTSCAQQLKSSDFTKEGSFTEGIEGPATDYEGNIYAVNFEEQGTIGKVTPNGEASVFVKLPNGSVGNGIRFGEKHQMFVADYVNHNVLEIDLRTKKIEVFAHEPTANQPNDIAIAPNGTLYASDPNWSDNTGKLWKVTKENGFELLEEHMGTTNGIEVSPDGKKLYVNESVQRKIWVYDILDNGFIENKQELISFDDFGLDGMRFDGSGNLYVCRYGKGTVVVLSSSGRVVREIELKGLNPSNITFSNDYKRCYITMADRGNLEVVEL
ncbi:SMP-30/gluconolactonase/LRE family protein [Gelidibacter maritimus]|uniref:SMP-30/gluconolactonase/LRE family protein n=1 Tax=Gelidibacter maritimus TaxID=2761487 RepID=A0A7W2R2S0_9FLAO|nr:SMP-30/gluconolactonase/LRE family protein [Gelidibacter maritimus]MBA6151195.1 SMP-30/gluconolactonase/LRE family protein [Gelidibacter maritimus]